MADLDRYRAKRRFGVTAEPDGARAQDGGEPIFVVQKHAARRLHYDFRLALNGVLKSWSVPEGPCLDAKVRRLAVETEDHPLDYADFEGRIPGGEYGGGAVIVWDRGAFVTVAEDAQAALAAGELKFRLVGEKLRGGWTLVRLARDPKNWLLIKERDDEVRPLAEYDVLKQAPRSVLSGRTVEELAAEQEPRKPKHAPAAAKNPERIAGARLGALPKLVSPQLAQAADAPPDGEGWIHEIKFDGYRTICRIEGDEVRLFTRNKLDWTHRYGPLPAAFRQLKCKSALIDGEIAVQDARGATSIALLERALSDGRSSELTFFAFDLLHLDGYDLTAANLIDRKAALAALLAPVLDRRSQIQFSDHSEGDGAPLFAEACRLGLEGIVSKRRDAPYQQSRTKTWLKVKRAYLGDFIVVGFTTNNPKRIASFLLAEHKRDGDLVYVGRVTCPTEALSREWMGKLTALAKQPPMQGLPEPLSNAYWTEPAAVARVAFNSRADDGAPRQPVLVSLSPYTPIEPATKPRLVTDRDLAAIRLTNPEREMFEGSGVTKLDIALYYARVGDWMLPELLRRPLSFIRCPTGKLADCFYQRHAFHGIPPGIATIDLSDEEGRGAFIFVESAQGFLALSQFGAVEFHPWPCRVDAPEEPDRFVLDLDPDPAVPWTQIIAGAEQLRAKLEALGFAPFVRTTGGKGLHLVMALAPKTTWPMLRGFAEAVAESAARDWPGVFTASPSKERRRGRIYLDWVRNTRGASAVASYSLRARPNFTVAAPIEWSELRGLSGPDAFDRKNMVKRLSSLAADPWDGLHSSATAISAKAQRAVGMKS